MADRQALVPGQEYKREQHQHPVYFQGLLLVAKASIALITGVKYTTLSTASGLNGMENISKPMGSGRSQRACYGI